MDITTLNVDPQALIIIGLLSVAAIKFVDELFQKDWAGAAKILATALVGGLVAFGIDGLGTLQGISVALAGSGLITVVGFTKKTTPVLTAPEQLG